MITILTNCSLLGDDLLVQDQHLREAIMHWEQGNHMISLFYLSLAFNLLVVSAVLGCCGYLWRQHRRLPASTPPTIDVVLTKLSPSVDAPTT